MDAASAESPPNNVWCWLASCSTAHAVLSGVMTAPGHDNGVPHTAVSSTAPPRARCTWLCAARRPHTVVTFMCFEAMRKVAGIAPV